MITTREKKLQRYGDGYNRLLYELSQVPKDCFMYRQRPDEWSINEIVVHLADLETAAYVNFRRIIAEPTQRIFAFDKDLWAESLPYYGRALGPSLRLFRLLRASNYLLLKNMEPHFWLHTAYYENHGQITLEDLLDLYERHLDRAVHEIASISEVYAKKHGSEK